MLPPFDPWMSGTAAAGVAAMARADDAALRRCRETRLGDLLVAAARGSRWVQDALAGRDPRRVRLQDLPIMRKAELMRRFDDWVADPQIRLPELRAFLADPSRIGQPYLGRYTVWESSGSSGESAVFVQDAAALAVYDALEALRRPSLRPMQRIFDPFWLAERVVFVGAIGGHFASTVSVERLKRLNLALAPSLHSVSFLQPMEQLVAQLNALEPTVLTTYPSAAVLLAEERAAGRLHISPQEVWTGGETLSPAMRSYVREVFGCPVVNSYGASEFLALACECRLGHLHLNSDWVILESVDDEHRPVPAGERGTRTLVTNLANHTQPIVRYELGDRITLHRERCDCGSRLPVVDVLGRSDDVLRLPGRGNRRVALLPLALTTVLEDDAGLFDFQLVQQGPAELCLTTAAEGGAAEAALERGRKALAEFLSRQGVRGVGVECRAGVAAVPGRSGKIQRVIAAAG